MPNIPDTPLDNPAQPVRRPSIRPRRGGIEWVAARLGVPALIAAVILQPNLAKLTSVNRLMLFAALLGGATALTAAFEWSPTWSRFRKMALPVTIAVCVAYACLSASSIEDEVANDKRCLAVQRDMLSSMPLRSDDPDIFQALGCKPQGEGSVYAERDTKEDADATIEQSARRSELPYRNPYRGGGGGAVLK